MGLVMPAGVPPDSVTCCPVVVARLGNRNSRRVPQIRREHQDERRDDPKREKRVQRRQDASKVSARIDRSPPRNGRGSNAT